MKSNKPTKKQGKMVGKQNFINSTTGELIEANIIQVEVDRDFNFHKVWLFHILQAFDALGNKKMKICNYILESMNSNNQIIQTQQQIADHLNITVRTVNETFSILKKANFLKKIGLVYVVNPDFIFKGYNSKRNNILLQYKVEEE